MRHDAATTRRRCVELAAEGGGPKAIAEALGLAGRTVRGHLNNPEVAAELRRLQDERLRLLTRRALGGADVALGVLRDLAEDGAQPAGARVAAAKALLDAALRLVEATDVVERLDHVESWLDVLREEPQDGAAGRWRRPA